MARSCAAPAAPTTRSEPRVGSASDSANPFGLEDFRLSPLPRFFKLAEPLLEAVPRSSKIGTAPYAIKARRGARNGLGELLAPAAAPLAHDYSTSSCCCGLADTKSVAGS